MYIYHIDKFTKEVTIMDEMERNEMDMGDSRDNVTPPDFQRDHRGDAVNHIGNVWTLLVWLENEHAMDCVISPSANWCKIEGRELPIEMLVTEVQILGHIHGNVEFDVDKVARCLFNLAHINGHNLVNGGM